MICTLIFVSLSRYRSKKTRKMLGTDQLFGPRRAQIKETKEKRGYRSKGDYRSKKPRKNKGTDQPCASKPDLARENGKRRLKKMTSLC